MTTDTKAVARWAVQEVPEEIEHIRCAKYPDLLAFHHGVSGKGPHAYNWEDKPHRLVYDLTANVAELRDEITDHERVVGELRAEIDALVKNAGRWVFVREQHGVTVSVEEAEDDGDMHFCSGHSPEQLDEAIDEAIKEQAE